MDSVVLSKLTAAVTQSIIGIYFQLWVTRHLQHEYIVCATVELQ